MSDSPWQDPQHEMPPPPPLARVYWRERARPTAGVQLVMLGWCLWLIGTWVMWSLIESPGVAARWMLMTAVLGLMALWPAARLSVRSHRPIRGQVVLRPVGLARLQAMKAARRRPQAADADRPGPALVFLEWASLTLLMMVVIWMLSLHVGWTAWQTLWLSVAVLSWSLMTALIVGWAYAFRSEAVRTGAMVLCLLLLVAEPIAMVILPISGSATMSNSLGFSPFEAIWQMSQPASKLYLSPWPPQVLRIGAAAAVGWLVVGGFALLRRRKDVGRGAPAP